MPPAVATETTETGKNGEIMERSSEDGQLYSKPTVGIIYPPPEVRNIVDRTANFVARNGPEFEERIRGNEINNPKFNFLNPNDPYNAYYQHKLKEFREGDLSQPEPQSVQAKDLGKAAPTTQNVPQVLETIIPKDPPPNYEFTIDPPTISAIDLDIVKLTAQFVAKNGKSFLTNLMTREQRNYQFDFLRPQHSLFQYFTRLVEQYTKVLLPPADISKTLTEDIVDGWKILDRVKYRVEWQKYQDREKRKEEDVKERERIAFAQIDWHDFVVVETVNFREEETANLPPPVTKDQLGTRLLAQERINKSKEGDEEEVVGEEQDDEEEEELYQPFAKQQKDDEDDKAGSDMEEESDNEEDQEDTTPIMPPPKAPPAMPANATIRKNYDPKAQQTPQQKTTEKFLISPLTGEKVPAESMDSHMKINLLDPRWKEQKEKAIEEKRQQERVFAEGVHIGDTLKQLAERRSDIFGVGTEETLIGKKIGEEEAPKKLGAEIWDGHSSSMERATKIAHSNITFEDQIKAIHKAKGLLPSEDAEKIGPAIPSNPSSSSASSSTSLPPPPVPPISTSRPPVSDSAPKPPVIRPTPPVLVKAPPQKPPMQRPPMPRPPMPMPPPNMPRPPMGGMMPPRPPMMNMGPPPPMMMMGPPPPGAMMPPPNFMPPPIQPPPAAPMVEEESDEPQSKKQKMDDLEAGLVSEQEFLQNNRLPVTFRVQVPDLPDKTEWQCQGQVLKIVFSLTTPCSVIKSKITEMIGMPVGKQKLQLGNFFIKDSNSLAFYNFDSSSLVQLQVKERGGRKK